MTFSRKPLQAMLLKELGTHLAAYGCGKRRGQDFYKVFDWGKWVAHVAFVDHTDDFDVTLDVAIRFDALEELVQQSNELLSDREKRQTCSMGVEIGNLLGIGRLRWTVTTEADVPVVARQISTRFEESGLPYLKQYSDMRQALEVLAGDEHDSWLHSPLHSERAKRAVGLAVLLHDPGIQELVTRKMHFLAARNDYGLPSFRKFVASLKIPHITN
jgi:hypothetical protein